jgi:hypothetical protein
LLRSVGIAANVIRAISLEILRNTQNPVPEAGPTAADISNPVYGEPDKPGDEIVPTEPLTDVLQQPGLTWSLVWLPLISILALSSGVVLLLRWEMRAASPARRASTLDLKVGQFADAVAFGRLAKADRILGRVFELQVRYQDPTQRP